MDTVQTSTRNVCLIISTVLRSATALSRTIISEKNWQNKLANRRLQIVLTHHKSDRRPVNDLQRVVACATALFMSVLDAFLISDIFCRKIFEIQNTSLGKTFENNFS